MLSLGLGGGSRPALGVGNIIVDAWGVQKVSVPMSLFSGKFTFNIDPAAWFMYENGTQVYTSTNITSTNSAGHLTADATKTSVLLQTRECPRYQSNRGHLFSTSVWCPNKTNDGIREWGLGVDGENAAKFRLKADGQLYFVIESGGVETYEAVIDTSLVSNFDVEKGNTYDIQFMWRGVGDYFIYINQKLVHTVHNLGKLVSLSTENPAMPVHFHCERTTQDVELFVGCVDVTSENGSRNDREAYVSCYAEGVNVGTDQPVIILHSPDTIDSKTNTRTLTLARISVSCSKKAVFKVWMTRNLADITGATFAANVNNGSYLETDSPDMGGGAVRATAATVANMNFVTSIPVEAASREVTDNPYRGRIEFPIVRGDYLVITCTAATAVAEAVIEGGEQR